MDTTRHGARDENFVAEDCRDFLDELAMIGPMELSVHRRILPAFDVDWSLLTQLLEGLRKVGRALVRQAPPQEQSNDRVCVLPPENFVDEILIENQHVAGWDADNRALGAPTLGLLARCSGKTTRVPRANWELTRTHARKMLSVLRQVDPSPEDDVC